MRAPCDKKDDLSCNPLPFSMGVILKGPRYKKDDLSCTPLQFSLGVSLVLGYHVIRRTTCPVPLFNLFGSESSMREPCDKKDDLSCTPLQFSLGVCPVC
jgi:hypothetical protein